MGIVYSIRSIGYSGLEKFSALMNLPSPMSKKNYNGSVKVITDAVTTVAKETMLQAAKEIKGNSNNIVDTGVSTDGTWQRRGYSSLNGVVTTLSMDNGKVLDVEPMSRLCKQCQLRKDIKSKNSESYKNWYKSHSCNVNCIGSAGKSKNMDCSILNFMEMVTVKVIQL